MMMKKITRKLHTRIVLLLSLLLFAGIMAGAFTPFGRRVAASILHLQPTAKLDSMSLETTRLETDLPTRRTANAAPLTSYEVSCPGSPEQNGDSLRSAFDAASNTGAGVVDTINLTAGCDYALDDTPLYASDGNNGLDPISNDVGGLDLTINGNGATIRRSSSATQNFRILRVLSGAEVVINNVTIRDGNLSSGAGFGGGISIASGATVTINDSTIRSNQSSIGAGGIDNDGTLTINRSLIYDNQSNAAGGGGGLYNFSSGATINLNNSTVSGNRSLAAGNGGGIQQNFGAVNISNSTITGNTANGFAGGIYKQQPSSTTIRNSIITGNTDNASINDDCFHGGGGLNITWQGTTLVGDNNNNRGCTGAGTTLITGASSTVLSALSNNGGPTQTHGIVTNGQADNAVTGGNCTFIGGGTVMTDQRGISRSNAPTACDAGAFETQSNSPPTAVSAGGAYTIGEGNSLSLSGSATDPDSDPLTYSWDVNGDGTFGDAAGQNPTLTWAQLNALGINDGPATINNVKVRVNDGINPAVNSTATSITVNNTQPTLTITGAATTTVGATYTLNLSSNDPGSDTISNWTINWGDGSPSQNVSGNPSSVTHSYGSPNTYTISATATDEDGTYAAGNTVSVTAACTSNPVVTTNADNGAGSLRQAVIDACADSTITFASPLFDSAQTINVNGQLVIDKSLTINGRGANLTTVRSVAAAGPTSRVFLINSGTTVNLNGLTITGGNLTAGVATNGCISSITCGGGINSSGNLTITNSVISGNTATNNSLAFGGGIYKDGNGTVTIIGSTISGNSVSGSLAIGGGIYNSNNTLTVINTTVSGNTASGSTSGEGGGIRGNLGTINIINSTVTNNSASNDGGGAVRAAATVNALNTVISGNSALNNPDLNGSLSGSSTNNLVGGNARLLPLGNYGGATPTHALLPDSPAINAGNDCVLDLSCSSSNPPAALTTDQRGAGFPRKVGSSVDIGAFEAPASLVVTNTNDSGAGSLRAAIAAANADPSYDAITFDIPASDAGCTNGVCTITLTSGEFTIAGGNSLSINGRGAQLTSVSGNNASRVFNINSGANVYISSLTISGGRAQSVCGGGIFADNSVTLVIDYSAIMDSISTGGGSCNGGGGVYIGGSGTLTVSNSTLSGNQAAGGVGGAIRTSSSTVNVINSTLSNNSAGISGGGTTTFGATLNLTNTTISGNTASSGAGIFVNGGTYNVRNTIIANSTGPDCSKTSDGTLNSQYSLVEDGSCGVTNGVNGNLTGDPRLAPLGFYGGATLTHALLSGSPAINAGTSTGAPAADQRGAARVGNVDIGSFELNNLANGGNFRAQLPAGNQFVPYNYTIIPNVGSFDSLGLNGSFPFNVFIDQTALVARGTPFQSGIFNFSVTITYGANSFTTDYALEILPPPDSTPPVITPTVTGTLGSNGWYTSDVQVSWSVVDDESTVSYQAGCGATSVTTDTAGVTFTCSAQSIGGNSSQSVTVKRDATAPQITFSSRTAPNANGWNNTNVAVQWNCADALSGAVSASVLTVLSTEGANQSALGICTDNAGNTAQNTQTGVNIDKTAPNAELNSSTNPPLQTNDTNASFNFTGTDNIASPANLTFECSLDDAAFSPCPSPQNYSGLSLGAHNFRVRATDQAGNVDPTPASYDWTILPAPTLGNYQNASVNLSGNTTVAPDAVPTNTIFATATTTADFKGKLEVDPATGAVRVTNAHPAGTYPVTVNAFGTVGTTAKTFDLTVSTPAGCNTFGTSAFAPAVNYATGTSNTGTQSVAIGDFNGDGRQDIVAANVFPGINTVSVFLRNSANDGFEPKVDYPAGNRPQVVAIGDINGDGRQDIIAGNRGGNISVLFRNTGNNGFDAPVNLAVADTTNSLTIGDLNGDGKLDIASTISGTSTVSVFYRNSDNTGFDPRVDLTATSGPNGMAIADFNGDGRADIIVVSASGSASLLYRNASNTAFDPVVNITLPTINAIPVAAGDFNGDGRQDFAVGYFFGNFVSVFLRKADNSGFDAPVNLTVNASASSIAVGDFNNDNRQDIATTNSGAGKAYVLLRSTDNTGFESPVSFDVGSSPQSIAVGDFNDDNRQDLVTANSVSNNISVLQRVCNTAPTANDDSYSVNEDAALNVGAPGVLSNDSDAEMNPLNSVLVSAPSNAASFALNADGSFSYTPAANFNGQDSFTYKASDGSLESAPAIVSINVKEVNDPPVAMNDSLTDIAEDSGQRTIPFSDLTANDSKGAANESGQTLIVKTVGNPTGGTVAINGGNVLFTPTENYNGAASFDYTIEDNGTTGGAPDPKTSAAAATASFTITSVNDEPSFTSVSNQTRQQGAPAANSQIAAVSDVETAAGSLTVQATTVPAGIFVTNIQNNNGTITADVRADCSASTGDNTVVLRVSDGDLSTNANLTVTVTANTPPMLSYPNAQVLLAGSTTINPTAASDNNGITEFALVSQGTYTGGIAVNPANGAVTITNAAPGGTHTIKISAKDSCNAATIAEFTLTVIAPTLGNYQNSTVLLSGNTTIIPDAAPTGAGYLAATISADFKGGLSVDSITGAVRVTNAHPANRAGESYAITVSAYNEIGGSISKTFNLTVTTPPGCGDSSAAQIFAPAVGFPAGFNPTAAVIGDFNSDGRQDIASVNAGDNSVRVLFRNAGNGFGIEAGAPPTVGEYPIAAAVADFNGDGKQDIATANKNGRSISLLLRKAANNGFETAIDLPLAGNPYSLAVGDFNADGRPDLAVIYLDGNSISVLLGNAANNGFETAVNLPVGTAQHSVAVGDVNGDGRADIVTANYADNTVSVLLRNQTNSGFVPAASYPVGFNPYAVTTGDFNGDGKTDIAATSISGNSVSVLLRNQTNDGFDEAADFGVGNEPTSIAVGDFDNNGKQDIVTASFRSNTVSVLLRNAANNGFDSPIDFPVGSAPFSIAVGDFNADGRQDLVTANFNDHSVSILERNCGAPAITTFPVLNLKQGAAAVNSTIASVSDAFAASGSLTVTATQVPPGISITDIVNNNGFVSANLAAACGATPGSQIVELTVSNGTLSSVANLIVGVAVNSPPSLEYPSVQLPSNGSTVVNPTTAGDDTGITQFALVSQGTYTGGIAVNPANGAVTITNAAPGGNHLIRIQATDNCSQTTIAEFLLSVDQVSISGNVFYGITADNQPKLVPDVLLSAAGANSISTTTNSNGAYLLGGLTPGGQYTVTPSKTGGANGITAFDATLVLRHVASGGQGANALNPNQLQAADCDSDNVVSAFDATQILRYVAAGGQRNGSMGNTGLWKFNPSEMSYPAVNNNASEQNYTAFLIGEINGDWSP